MALSHMRQTPQNWDLWILTETWREEEEEIMDFHADEDESEEEEHKQTKEDTVTTKAHTDYSEPKDNVPSESPKRARRTHSLFACGGKKCRGVAIVVNARHTKDAQLVAVNANICAVDIKIHGKKARIIAIYMPHAGKCADEQEAVYQEIAKLIKVAKD